MTDVVARHTLRFGVNSIHEPVLSGALTSNTETLVTFPQNPAYYLLPGNLAQFSADYLAGSAFVAKTDGGFSQNVQRLGVYAEDSWPASESLTLNFALRSSPPF